MCFCVKSGTSKDRTSILLVERLSNPKIHHFLLLVVPVMDPLKLMVSVSILIIWMSTCYEISMICLGWLHSDPIDFKGMVCTQSSLRHWVTFWPINFSTPQCGTCPESLTRLVDLMLASQSSLTRNIRNPSY